MSERFTYYALYPRDPAAPPVGLLAEGRAAPDLPRRVVGWSHRSKTWKESAASLGAYKINTDWDDRMRPVDRATAERIARENLGADLPTEEEMQRIGDLAAEEYDRKWGPTGN